MESVKTRMEDLADSITTISADPYGAKIFGKRVEDSIDVFMIEPGDDRARLVGTIKELDSNITLYKKENEKDKHRNTFSWSILKFFVPYIDAVVYETDFATYTATPQAIERNSFYLPHRKENRGYMEKIFLRCKDWEIKCKDLMDQKRMNLLGYEWYTKLYTEFRNAYMQELGKKVANLRKRTIVYPENEDIFNAYKLTPYNDVKVVVIGQDPYHDGSAHGLAFSIVKDQIKVPPSLKNILKEVEEDYADGFYLNAHTNLDHWAKQGVFLINTVLTVEKGHPASHSKIGWQQFTKATLKYLLERPSNTHKPMVFMLWGKHAQEFEGMIDHDKHLVLKAAHPSPFSAHKGFFGCKHFTKCNDFLELTNQNPIVW